jgi:hypothetical protein
MGASWTTVYGSQVSLGTLETHGLVHEVSHCVSPTLLDVFVTYCGLFVSNRDMHNKPKVVTCLQCIVAIPKEGWV